MGRLHRIPFVDYLNQQQTLYIQNQEIDSNRYYQADTVFIGQNVTDSISPGPVKIKSGKVTINSNSVILNSGFSIEKGAELEINTPLKK